MKPYQWLMALALVGAGGLAVFGDKTPGADVAEPVERVAPTARAASAPAAAAAPARQANASVAAAEPAILALRPRADLVGEEGAEFGAKDAVFQSQNWNPPAPPPPPASVEPPAPPPPPPSAPPVPFTVLGKAVGDGSWEVFLARGEQTYIVRLHSVIDGQYRIDAIAPPTMTMTYLPLKQVQQINIGVLD